MKQAANTKFFSVALSIVFFLPFFFVSIDSARADMHACFMNGETECQDIAGTFTACSNICTQKGKSNCSWDQNPCPPQKSIACMQTPQVCAEDGNSCQSNDFNNCKDIIYFLASAAVVQKCQTSGCPTGYFCEARQDKCANLTQRGCYINGKCSPVTAADMSDAEKKCFSKASCGKGGKDECEVRAIACLPPKDYGCLLKNGECFNNRADSFLDAQIQCKADCGGTDDCQTMTDPCENQSVNDPNSYLYGTGLPALKQQAMAILNPAKIDSPYTLISHAINLLVGFIGSLALLLYVVAGFLWMTASGASERVDRAKRIMVWTTLGVIVMLLSYILTTTLFDLTQKL